MHRALAVGLLLLLVSPPISSAQITTGSVAGTVKDSQGGVIAGAIVALISETRGTSATPVVSSESGDFTFVNIPADTYTIEVTQPGFKSLHHTGVPVSAGDRVVVGTLTIEVGGATETVSVVGEAPVIQANSGERSYTINTASVENLPIANRSFTALATLAPGVSGMSRIGGGGTTFVMMDGISAIDTGSNGAPILQMNVESIAEVKMLTSGYQAEYGRSSGLQITAVTKSGTNRFRGSVYDGTQFRLEQQQQGQQPERRSQAGDEGARLGLFDRRSRGQTWWQQQALLLLCAGVLAAHGGQRRRPLSHAHRARASGRLLADDRQSRQSLSVRQGSESERHVLACESGGLFRRWRRTREDPREPALSARPEHSQDVADAQHGKRAGSGVQLRAHAAGREHPQLAACFSRGLSADAEAARHLQVLRAGSSEIR